MCKLLNFHSNWSKTLWHVENQSPVTKIEPANVWFLLSQISVAVLLDSFLTARSQKLEAIKVIMTAFPVWKIRRLPNKTSPRPVYAFMSTENRNLLWMKEEPASTCWDSHRNTEIQFQQSYPLAVLFMQAKEMQEQAARNTIRSALDPLLHVCHRTA